MKRKITLIIISYLFAYLLGLITMPIFRTTREKTLQDSIIYDIVVDVEYINLRKDIDLSENPIKKVYKGEKFSVVEYYEGNSFNWYKVIYEDSNTGWLASGKDESWVIVKEKESIDKNE